MNMNMNMIAMLTNPVIIAGSINSFEKLEKVKKLNPWGFTIGNAVFNKKFVKGVRLKSKLRVL